jgi:hypothetical protein
VRAPTSPAASRASLTNSAHLAICFLQLSDLLEEAIAKETTSSDPTAAPSTEITSDATLAPAASADEPAFPPVFNEDETPIQRTAEQIAQTEREEQAGASLTGAEGAQQAGITMSAVEPEAEQETKADGEGTAAGAEVEMKEEVSTAGDEKADGEGAMDGVEEKAEEGK